MGEAGGRISWDGGGAGCCDSSFFLSPSTPCLYGGPILSLLEASLLFSWEDIPICC